MRLKNLPLRARLPLLVAGTMLPPILFATALVHENYVGDRDAAFERVLESVRGMRVVLDREMQTITSALQILALSQALQKGDLDGFRIDAATFLKEFSGSSVVLAERSGRQLLNSRIPAGTPLPGIANMPPIEQVFATGKPAYSNLFVGSVGGQRIMTIAVPVRRGGEVVLALSFSPPLALFQSIIEQQRPSNDWTITIFDRTGINFARVPNPQATLGQRASATLYPELQRHTEAKLVTFSLEGTELITAFTRSPVTGWTVAAGLPVSTLTQPLWKGLAVTGAVGAVMLAIGLTFAIGMARRIAHGETLHELLLAELNHRVKNTLATVQSIALQTLRTTRDPKEAQQKLDARLLALARAHNVLSTQKWEGAAIRDVVNGVVEPYGGDQHNRVQASGPDLRLNPRCTVMLSVVLHELATNAAKYGALSDRGGKVSIDWTTDGRELKLTWRETEGPAVTPTDQKGFGSRLIEQAFKHQLGGRAEIDFQPTGVVCTLECPLDRRE